MKVAQGRREHEWCAERAELQRERHDASQRVEALLQAMVDAGSRELELKLKVADQNIKLEQMKMTLDERQHVKETCPGKTDGCFARRKETKGSLADPKIRLTAEATKGPNAKPDVSEVPVASVSLGPLRAGLDAASGSKYFYDTRTGDLQWERPEPAPASGICSMTDLPPGWEAVWDESDGRYYYFDAETQCSQWDAPKPYCSNAFRCVDDSNRASWMYIAESGIGAFYEQGSTVEDLCWRRIVDQNGRVYWSNQQRNLRFFEK